MRARIRLLLSLLLVLAGRPANAASEAERKASYILKFASFATWPAEILADGKPLIIGVVGNGDVAAHLERSAAVARVKNHPLVVRRIATAAEAVACALIYFGDGNARPPLLASLHNAPVLTVGESASFCSDGGVIGFRLVGSNLRFTINKGAAAKARIELSAQLIRLSVAE